MDGQKVRAWRAEQFDNLATLILPAGTEVFKDNVWTLFMAQNTLEGQHGKPRVLPLNKGMRRLLVGVSADLAAKIRNLGLKAPLGGYTVAVHVSKYLKS